jgi:hypothetical protein
VHDPYQSIFCKSLYSWCILRIPLNALGHSVLPMRARATLSRCASAVTSVSSHRLLGVIGDSPLRDWPVFTSCGGQWLPSRVGVAYCATCCFECSMPRRGMSRKLGISFLGIASTLLIACRLVGNDAVSFACSTGSEPIPGTRRGFELPRTEARRILSVMSHSCNSSRPSTFCDLHLTQPRDWCSSE